MAFDPLEFIKDVPGLTPDQITLLQSTLANPVLSKRLEEGQMRQSDYSRQVAEAQEQNRKALEYYNRLQTWETTKQQELEAERKALGLGDAGAGGGDPEYLSKTDFQKRLSEVETGAIGFLTVLNATSMRHFKEFGAILDTNAVLDKARQDGTNFAIAYDRFVQPDREAKSKVELEERIARERKEAAAEALANVSIPTGNQGGALAGGQPHVLDMIADKTRSYGWKAAADAHTRDIAAGTVKHE